MAIIKFTNSKGGLKFMIRYVTDKDKTTSNLITGKDCLADSTFEEMKNVKILFNKNNGRQYVHIVQSFDPEDELTPKTAHEIGLKFAEYFKEFQAVVSTHEDREHIHNHIVLNTVNFKTGKKFHQTIPELDKVKIFSNELCREYELSETPIRTVKDKLSQGEYMSALKLESWKFELINVIEDALLRSRNKKEFINNLNYEGYEVIWKDTRKNITFINPEGKKCRDNKLHDETYLKENLELIFKSRNIFGFKSMSGEPEIGYLNDAKRKLKVKDIIKYSSENNKLNSSFSENEIINLKIRKLKKRSRHLYIAEHYTIPSEIEQDNDWDLKI